VILTFEVPWVCDNHDMQSKNASQKDLFSLLSFVMLYGTERLKT